MVQIGLTTYLIKTQAFIVSRDLALYAFLQFVVNIYLQKCKLNNPIVLWDVWWDSKVVAESPLGQTEECVTIRRL